MTDVYDTLLDQQQQTATAPEAPQAPADTYDVLLDQQQAEQRRQLGAVLDQASKFNPDQAAQAAQLSRDTGLPPDTVERNLDEVARRQQVQNLQRATANSPMLARQLLDPSFAKVTHDDVGNLSGIESGIASLARYVTGADPNMGLWRDIAAAPFAALKMGAGVARAGVDLLALPERGINALTGAGRGPLQAWGDSLGDTAKWAGQRAQDIGSKWSPDSLPGQIFGAGATSGVQSAGMTLGSLGLASWLLGPEVGIPVTIGLLSAGQGGSSYQESREKGRGVLPSLAYGAQDATAEYIGERYLGLAGFAERAFAGATVQKLVGYELFKEMPGEIGTQLWQNFNQWTNLNPDKSLRDFLAEQPASVAQTAVATLTGGGAQIGVVKLADQLMGAQVVQARNARFAERQAQVFAELSNMAANDKVLQRDPDTFQSFIQSTNPEDGPAHTVFVPAQVLMQSGIADELAAVSPSVAEQLPDAAQTGGLVSIPVDEYLTKIAPTQYSQGLIDHLKINDPMAPSRAEAQEYFQSGAGAQLQQDVERAVATQAADTAFKQSADQVRETILGQLNATQRFTPQANEAYATLAGSWYAIKAAEFGITPEEQFQRYPLRVQAESVAGGPVLDQAGGLDVLREQWRAQGIDASVSEHDGVITLSKIVVPKESRNNGQGTNAMQALVDYADRTGQHVALSPSADFGGSKKRLADFYKRFGFVENKGKNRAFSTSESMYRQAPGKVLEQPARGSFNPESLTISLLQNADLSTFLHESGHFFLEAQADMASRPDAPESVKQDMAAVLKWFGVRDLPEWYGLDFEVKRTYHEQFARGFEAYLFEGKAPSLEMQGVFQKFRAWMLNVYRKLTALNVQLDDEVRGVFDRMIASNEQILLAEQGRSMMPLFESAQQAGITPEEFAAYQALGNSATQDAVQDLQARGLRDMQWLHNARSRVIKQLQQKAEGARKEVRVQARAEIMRQPVYRAWQFLTGRLSSDDKITPPTPRKADPNQVDETQDSLFTAIAKLGGLDRSEVQGQWGTTSKDVGPSPVFGKPVLRKEGGRSIDDMRQALMEYGYLDRDESSPDWNPREFEDKFDAELRGDTQYSMSRDFAPEQRAGDQLANPDALGAGRLDIGELRSLYGYDQRYTPTRIADTLDDARKAAEAFIGKPLRNGNLTATMSKGTLGKMTSKKAVEKSTNLADHSLAVANADKLFENAVLNRSHPDSKGEATIQAMHRYVAPMITPDGRIIAVKMTVKETTGPNEPNPLYTVETLEIESPPSVLSRAHPDETGMHPQAGFSDNVLRLLQFVKDKAEQGAHLVAVLQARHMTAKTGLHPDIVADMFGFSSGDEMARALAMAEPPASAIEGLTDAMMLQQHGELATPEAIEREADKAIHNDARARFTATEASILERMANPRADTGRVNAQGRRLTQGVLLPAARQYAAAAIARLKVRDIRPGQYVSAETRAGKLAEQARKSGDIATAAAEKRNQVIQQQLTRAAHAAQDEVDAGLRYLRKFSGDVRGLDAGYREQIDSLLERFDLRSSQSNKAVDRRTALAEWLKSQREAGFEPDIPANLENEAFRTSYKNMTVEDFRGLLDTVRQIEHLGRLKNRLLTAVDQRAYEAVRDEIATSIRDNAGNRKADARTPTTNMGRTVQGLKRFWASHIKAATWARVMDGGKDGGPVWEYLVRSANERGDMESTLRAEATNKLTAILAPVFKLGKMGGKGQYFPSIDRSLNREARLAIALNVGNEGNAQRLLGGEGWTTEQIAPVLQSLTTQEWQAVQAIWNHFDEYRPLIGAKERRVYGKEPAWVEPRPFTVLTADGQSLNLAGGYYPIKYDPAASQRAEEHADAEGAKRQVQGAYTTATTRRSFTKARVEEVSGRPLLYTLSGMYSGVNDVIHDLTWHEWLIDANRLLRSQTIDKAIRDHYGPEVKNQFKTWAADIAEGDKAAATAGDMALGRLRQGISAAGLGFNVMSALMQPLGLTQSIVRVGAPWVGRGITKYIASPRGLTREVNAMSEFMANRTRTRFRELAELRDRVQDGATAKAVMSRYTYFLMMRVQQMVDVPTWWGAYEKAIADGNEDARAISLADQAVIDSQGGGQTKDLAAIERGGPAVKLFTVFYTFMNTALNAGVTQTMTANTPAKRAKLAADYALLYVVPAVLGYALKNALTPGDSGDDDPEKLVKHLLGAQLDYLTGLMFGVREFSEAAKSVAGVGGDWAYEGPAGLRAVGDITKFAQQMHQGEFDSAFLKAAVNTVGDLMGLPSAQVNRFITGSQALAEGKTANPAALVFGFQRPH